MYLPLNNIPNIVQLVEEDGKQADMLGKPLEEVGARLYKINCAACHGEERKGNSGFPALLDIKSRLKSGDINLILKGGRGKMPSFPTMEGEQKDAIISFLLDTKSKRTYKGKAPILAVADTTKRFRIKAYMQLRDQFGYPGIKPPWGILCALNLNSGEVKWKIPLGEFPELVAKGVKSTGTQLFGGAIVTGGGLVFIGSSQDEKFRSFDKGNGRLLWEYQLPAGGYATPSTYEVDRKQFVVIAAGGGGFQRTKTGDYYVAFAIP